jgi:hypothetical protein
MPLSPGNSRSVISQNISEMVHSGYPQRQAVAASLSNARRHPEHRDMGGGMMPAPDPSGAGGMAPSAANQNPMVQQRLQQMAQLPVEKLQELAVRMPPGSPQGSMIQRVLQMKRMQPQQQQQQAPSQPSGGGMTGAPQQLPQQGYAMGGMTGVPLGEAAPWWERSEERGMETGYLHGSTLGRADHLTTQAPGGSYVVPADVISGLGEGNSLAGARVVQEMLRSGPYGTPLPRGGGGHSMPRPPAPAHQSQQQYEAKGGGVQGDQHGIGKPIPVKLSDGEYVIHPAHVLRIGRAILRRHGGKGMSAKHAMKAGHDALDAWVEHERKKHAKTLTKLPGPTR